MKRIGHVDAATLGLIPKIRYKIGRPRKLTAWQVSYIRRAYRLRPHLTNTALAVRFGVSRSAVVAYAHARHKADPKPIPAAFPRRSVREGLARTEGVRYDTQ